MKGFIRFTSPSDESHRYFFLDDAEKQGLFELPRTFEAYAQYWQEKLEKRGIEVKRILGTVQLKDLAGNWMNVFRVNYK